LRKAPLGKFLAVLVGLLLVNSVYACAVILGQSLKFVDSGINDEPDGGFGLHLLYEMTEWKDWHFGSQLEYTGRHILDQGIFT